MKRLVLLDDDGEPTGAGDTVEFSYGIPPVRVVAPVIERDGRLVALTPGHTPVECKLRSLRYFVGSWYKQNDAVRREMPAAGSETTPDNPAER